MAFFVWGTIAIVFGVLWLGALIAFISSRFYKSKIARWIGFLPFAAMTAGAIWFVASLYYLSTPAQVFKTSFGFTPTNDVREIKSKYWYFGDSGSTDLQFKANSQTIQRIVAMGLKETEDSKKMARIYSATNRIKDFASEEETLSYDERTQQAYYSFQGID